MVSIPDNTSAVTIVIAEATSTEAEVVNLRVPSIKGPVPPKTNAPAAEPVISIPAKSSPINLPSLDLL